MPTFAAEIETLHRQSMIHGEVLCGITAEHLPEQRNAMKRAERYMV